MPKLSRRRFLGSSLAAAGTVALSHTKSSGRILGANDAIRVAVAGLNGRGNSHVGAYLGMAKDNVRITYLIDPDTRTYKKHLDAVAREQLPAPATVTDVRKALEDKNLDAVSIATPNHWHALMTIWACQAGKDVYVEKPCSHNVHEGRIAVEAARKYDRVVQHGTQSRASKEWARLAEVVKSGKLGKLLVSYGLCYKDRKSIGSKPTTPAPKEVDFDLWLGPAAQQPHHANLVHYNWHWFWDFGNGDIGNQGVHQMDVARWMIPGATLPNVVWSFGGRYGYQDQGQTPNTQVAVFTFPDCETKLIFEVRGLPSGGIDKDGQNTAMKAEFGITLPAKKPGAPKAGLVGNVLKFESGIVAENLFFPTGKDTPEPLPKVDDPKRGPGGIFENFVHAVRTRKRADQHADILEAHYSSVLCHLPNVSYRTGTDGALDTGIRRAQEIRFVDDAANRMAAHLAGHGVDPARSILQAGRLLRFDPKAERFIDAPEADKLLTREYRKPFAVPEKA